MKLCFEIYPKVIALVFWEPKFSCHFLPISDREWCDSVSVHHAQSIFDAFFLFFPLPCIHFEEIFACHCPYSNILSWLVFEFRWWLSLSAASSHHCFSQPLCPLFSVRGVWWSVRVW